MGCKMGKCRSGAFCSFEAKRQGCDSSPGWTVYFLLLGLPVLGGLSPDVASFAHASFCVCLDWVHARWRTPAGFVESALLANSASFRSALPQVLHGEQEKLFDFRINPEYTKSRRKVKHLGTVS